MKIKKRFQPIGLRLVKSAVAVFICFLIHFIRGQEEVPFYAVFTALFCMQNDLGSSKTNAKIRILGTTIGAFWGCLVLMINLYILENVSELYKYLLVSIAIIPVIYMTVLIKKKNISFFTGVVFLGIAVTRVTDSNPYFFVLNRVLDTLIGIFVSIGVNQISLPRNYNKDILFTSGLDETLIDEDEEQISSYNRVELNRMIDHGALFTISTERTIAALMDSIGDIHLKLPVIAFDGAVLFDIQEKKFLRKKVINKEVRDKILTVCKEENIFCFNTALVQDTLLIYYDEFLHTVEKDLYKKLHTSLYRNYIKGLPSPDAESIYLMCVDTTERITKLYHRIKEFSEVNQIRMTRVLAKDHPGYIYLKIYHKEATKENMINELKGILGIEKSITLGTIPGKYDILIQENRRNNVVKSIKKMYQPVKWAKKQK